LGRVQLREEMIKFIAVVSDNFGRRAHSAINRAAVRIAVDPGQFGVIAKKTRSFGSSSHCQIVRQVDRK
jgi:hypothetical protein